MFPLLKAEVKLKFRSAGQPRMKWYYSSRSDVTKRGVVDDAGLAELLGRGDLKATDLICSESTGNKWVPVSAVNGLLDPPMPPPLRLAPREQRPHLERKPGLWKRVLLVVMAFLAAVLMGIFLRHILMGS